MAADLSHLLSVDKIKHKYEKNVKDIMWMFPSGENCVTGSVATEQDGKVFQGTV